jgi:hypothetical protein
MLPRPVCLCRPRRSSRLGRRGKPWLLDLERRIPARDRFAPDSPLEEDGFEPSVPPEEGPTSSRCSTFPALPLVESSRRAVSLHPHRYCPEPEFCARPQVVLRRPLMAEVTAGAVRPNFLPAAGAELMVSLVLPSCESVANSLAHSCPAFGVFLFRGYGSN